MAYLVQYFRIFIAVCLALLTAWIVVDTSKRPEQLISLAGYVILIFCLFLSSKYPYDVRKNQQQKCIFYLFLYI